MSLGCIGETLKKKILGDSGYDQANLIRNAELRTTQDPNPEQTNLIFRPNLR